MQYFTLFYIAFLIHFQFFPGMKTGCSRGSCMAELQWQLLIVFTGKTVMKKIVEMSKPFIKSCARHNHFSAPTSFFLSTFSQK